MNIPRITYYSRRHFWAWLNIVWNRVDDARIQEVGHDRACAEWLMRNGAYIKWIGENQYLKDYDALRSEEQKFPEPRYIEEIDATDSTIMHVGFPHFYNCKHVKRIKFHRCYNIEDKALRKLEILKDTLQHLQVSSCGNVSDDGIKALKALSNLQTLLLYDLPEVKNREECTYTLKSYLPACEVDFRHPEPTNKS